MAFIYWWAMLVCVARCSGLEKWRGGVDEVYFDGCLCQEIVLFVGLYTTLSSSPGSLLLLISPKTHLLAGESEQHHRRLA